MRQSELANTLRRIYRAYHSPAYLGLDPLICVRCFDTPRERELVGLVAAALSYGRVENIIAGIRCIVEKTGGRPLDFTLQTCFAEKKQALAGFKHRFNDGLDVALLLETIRVELEQYGSLESMFLEHLAPASTTVKPALEGMVAALRRQGSIILGRHRKSFEYLLPSPASGSACKRLNMYLRWMVRGDDGIDLGVWRSVSPALLIMPLDAHVARAAAKLGLSRRKTADWRMAEEITVNLKKVDPDDPVKYDFSLCRHGMVLFRKGKHGRRDR